MTERGTASIYTSPDSGSAPDAFTLLRHNRDVAWDSFDPIAYWQHNYQSFRRDDRSILRLVGKHFQGHFGNRPPAGRTGLDVGSGANLYPALAMLPWCEKIVLTDHSAANVAWLRQAIAQLPPSWEPFWSELVGTARYRPADFAAARQLLAARGEVRRRSVFASDDGIRYDLGTMFFVAESMTNYPEEFEEATTRFLAALRPAAPFAAAFMDSSEGYLVADRSFPAVKSVTVDRVRAVLTGLGADATVTKIHVLAEDPLREGYDGMIVAVGTVAGATGDGGS